METFAPGLVEMVNSEKKKLYAFHDSGILENNMALLKIYSPKLKNYTPETDNYDFTQNDCKNLVDSTKKWLTLEKLI